MRKVMVIALLVALPLVFSALAFAEEPGMPGSIMQEEKAPAKECQGKMKMGEKGMMKCCKGREGCCMQGMMGSMMSKQIIATTDGGIVVLAGNKITKFDKDLNLVKEAEIKMDMEGMQKMMLQMKEKCPAAKEKMEVEKEAKQP
jgi:hypothetical protein